MKGLSDWSKDTNLKRSLIEKWDAMEYREWGRKWCKNQARCINGSFTITIEVMIQSIWKIRSSVGSVSQRDWERSVYWGYRERSGWWRLWRKEIWVMVRYNKLKRCWEFKLKILRKSEWKGDLLWQRVEEVERWGWRWELQRMVRMRVTDAKWRLWRQRGRSSVNIKTLMWTSKHSDAMWHKDTWLPRGHSHVDK